MIFCVTFDYFWSSFDFYWGCNEKYGLILKENSRSRSSSKSTIPVSVSVCNDTYCNKLRINDSGLS